MARRKLISKLIKKDEIKEEIKLIKGGNTDYISSKGNIYKDYGNDLFYPKSNFINKENGYLYSSITSPEGQKQRRVHILVAEVFLPNPDGHTIVMHKNNDKANPEVANLEWGTIAKNTKDAYRDGLAKTDKNWNDSQSVHMCSFDMQGNLLKTYGSIGEVSRELHITKTAIINQCKHNVKTKPRCGYWFRYLTEYKNNGFVL